MTHSLWTATTFLILTSFAPTADGAVVIRPGQSLPDLQFQQNGSAMVIDLAGRYDDAGITGTLVRFSTTSGQIDVELFNQFGSSRARSTPLTVANFLSYANSNRYSNTVVHRSVPGFIVQGGGFRLPTANNSAPTFVPTDPAVLNEPGNSNIRGTIALAKLGGDPNSATNQWFFNLADNSQSLNNQNGGFTVFGRIINGIEVPAAIASLRRFNFGSPFNELPVHDSYDGQTIRPTDFVNVSDISVNSDRVSVVNQSLRYTITVANPTVATARLYNGRLLVVPVVGQSGTTDVTVRVVGVDGQFVDDIFSIDIGPAPADEQLRVTPVPINGVGGPYALSAQGTAFSGQPLASVRFYLDTDRDGNFSGSDLLLGEDTSSVGGYTLTGSAARFVSGPNLVFARGTLLSGGFTGLASQLAEVGPPPPCDSISGSTAVSLGAFTLGGSVQIQAAASGTNPLFEWRKDGQALAESADIVGAQSPLLTLLNLSLASQGNYSCRISNPCSNQITPAVALNCRPIFATQPPAQVNVVGSTTISGFAGAGPAVTYRWRRNGQNLFNVPGTYSGVTTPSLTILRSDSSIAGDYHLVATNGCGTTTSETSAVSCTPAIVSQPPTAAALVAPLTLSIGLPVGSSYQIQWTRNDQPLTDQPGLVAGSMTASLSLLREEPGLTGTYRARVSNSCGNIDSSPTLVSCADPIIVEQPPARQRLFTGATISVGVPAASSYSFQWRQDQQPLFDIPGLFSGTTTAQLVIELADVSIQGSFDCLVSSACGETLSSAAFVACAADFNIDATIDPDDLADYITAFFQVPSAPAADFNEDGTVDPDDLADFITAFFAGC